MGLNIHIIAHETPWPADHGGLMDISFKLKSLHQAGIQIHLHIFSKNKRQEPILHQWCKQVYYYKRSFFNWIIHPNLPYIVASRINKALQIRLEQDNYPILCEGTHTSFYISLNEMINRKMALRLHNIEYVYYRELAKCENNLLKKCYYRIESYLLKKYEKKIFSKAPLLSVSNKDTKFIQNNFPNAEISFLPVFLPWTEIKSETGKGNYCLYHGNLSVSENVEAATWLLEKVFSSLDIPFVIAGLNPPKKLIELAHKQKHTCLVANPSEFEMEDMIRKAHLHLIPSFNQTGIKLKLLHVMYSGRFCLTNKTCIEGSGLEKACIVFSDARQCNELIREFYDRDFTEEDISFRKEILGNNYDNKLSAEKIIKRLY